MSTYTVYAGQIDEVNKRLERMGKKAETYGVSFSYSIGEEYPATVSVNSIDPVSSTIYSREKYTVPAVDIIIECDELIRANGWSVRAKIEHGDKGNIVTGFENKPVDPAWYTAPASCDHCKTNRYRSVTFICEDEAGNIRQVGKSCLKEYTGINPATAAMWAEVRDALDKGLEWTSEEWESRKGSRMYEVTDVLAHACDAIRELGYRKSDEQNSTREIVTDRVVSGKTPSEGALETAEKVREWLCSLDQIAKDEDAAWLAAVKESEENADEYGIPAPVKQTPHTFGDLERNCIQLAMSGYAEVKHIGRLAYMPLAHEKYLERQERARKREEERASIAAASGYVGEVGQKLTILAEKAKLVTSWDGYYGTTWLYSFTDASGNVFIWKSSRCIEVKDGMKLKGSVKEHREYDGIKQTVMTRCSVT